MSAIEIAGYGLLVALGACCLLVLPWGLSRLELNDAFVEFFAERHNIEVVDVLLEHVTPEPFMVEEADSPVTGKTVKEMLQAMKEVQGVLKWDND